MTSTIVSTEPSIEPEAKLWKSDPTEFSRLVVEGAQTGVANAIAEHHRLGYAVVIQEEGQMLWLMPDGSTRPCIPGEPPPDRQ